MIRVMVVEDEPIIAQSIKRMVEQYPGEQTQVVQIAINGKRALEYLESNQVDVIFSDIKMPVMSGLDMAYQVSEQYPHIPVIVISGFQRFDFAQQAIQYGVWEYLLKPIAAQELFQVLDRVRQSLEKEQKNKIKDLISTINPTKIEADSTETEHNYISILCVGNYPLMPDELELIGTDLWNQLDLDQFAQTIFLESETFLVSSGKNLAEKIILYTCVEEKRSQEIEQLLFSKLNSRLDRPVSVLTTKTAIPTTQVGRLILEMRKYLAQKMQLFSPQLLFFSPLQKERVESQAKEIDTPKEETATLITALKTNSKTDIFKAVDSFVKQSMHQHCTQTEFVTRLENVIVNIYSTQMNMRQLGEIIYDIQSIITIAKDADEFVFMISQVLTKWIAVQQDYSQKSDGRFAQEVANYIRRNYNKNITTSQLSEEYGVPANQLAKRFKDYYKRSISEYVNEFRIELAQNLMEHNPDIMVKEVAISVGFNDQYYFSKIFKKITGLWPTQYMDEKNK